jgi:hypothetical protein
VTHRVQPANPGPPTCPARSVAASVGTNTQTPLDAQFRLLQQPIIPRAIYCAWNTSSSDKNVTYMGTEIAMSETSLNTQHFYPWSSPIQSRPTAYAGQGTHCGYSCPYKWVYFRAPEHRHRPRAPFILKQGWRLHLVVDFRSDWQVVSRSGRMSAIYLLTVFFNLSNLFIIFIIYF